MKIGTLRMTDVGACKRAEVQVTTGALWWKRTEWREVYMPPHSTMWRWADSGDFCPQEVERRANAVTYCRGRINRPARAA